MEKHKLLVMRHAKSDWNKPYKRDFDRPLSKRGLKDSPRMGQWLKLNALVPDMIVSSPARRARHTAELVVTETGLGEKHLAYEQDLYDASLEDLLSVIEIYANLGGSLMLVGHNAGLDYLVEYMSRDPPPYNDAGKLMTTAAIAVLEFDDGIKVSPGKGNLLHLVRPRELNKGN